MTSHRLWSVWLAVLGSMLLLVLNPGVRSASATQFNQGLQDGWAIGDKGEISGGQLLSDELATMQAAGAGWVRVNFRLGPCFPNWTSPGCNGKTAMQTYDQVLANAQARNLKILGLLSSESWHGQQSDWTANNAENVGGGTGTNAYIQAFAQNAAAVLANHYNGTAAPLVNQWEVWNEPNAWTSNPTPGVYSGSSFMYPSNFAALLSQSASAIANANRSATIISGGVLGLDPGGHGRGGVSNGYKGRSSAACPSGVPSGGDFLCATYDMGRAYQAWTAGHSPFAVVGQHLYVNQGGTTTSNNLSKYLNDLRNVYESYGGEPASRRTQVTEFGWSSGSVSAAMQAKNLQTAYQTLKGNPYIERGYWYRTQDLGVTADYYGLLTTNGVQKAALSAYQKYAAY